jgi:hypothetical protein
MVRTAAMPFFVAIEGRFFFVGQGFSRLRKIE